MRYSLSIRCNAVRPKYRRAVKLSAALMTCAAISGSYARAAGAAQNTIAASSPDGAADPKTLLAARGLLEYVAGQAAPIAQSEAGHGQR